MTEGAQDTRRMPFADLANCLSGIFETHGCAPGVARILANNCASAERDGAKSHGLFRMPGYVATLKSGWVDGRAVPVVEDAAASVLRIDARNGFTQPALEAARAAFIAKARATGIALLAIRNSHHFAALSLDVEPFADEGFVALSFINSMAVVVPHGARKPVFGTNPIAFATPRSGGAPLVFDMATSAMAHGDVSMAAREGRAVPPGTGVDGNGLPTTDAAAIVNGGALVPFGGHKGSAIALMVEVMCAALAGGKFSYEVDWSGHPGAQTPHTGQTILIIDPACGAGNVAPLAQRVEELLGEMAAAGQERLPGDRRHAARAISLREGIAVTDGTARMLRELGGAI